MTLREARFFKRLTQCDVSIKTKIPQTKISLIERGYVEASENEKKALSKALGVPVSELFKEEK